MEFNHKIVFGDSRDMTEIQDKSVHLVVTSPPYWQLKDYGSDSQIGFNQSYEDYINNLNLVWQECHRVLHDGCRLCINIGDQFARSVYYGRYKVIPIRTEIIKFCETIGFDYMGAVIWQKVSTTNTTGGASIMGSFPYPRNGILKLDYEFILIFKKHGTPPKATPQQKENSKLTIEEWNSYFSGHWNFPGAKQEEHLAMFPEELPKRLIKMFSFENDVVLDPFLGSGTTSLVAQKLNRNSIGYEINPDFSEIINRKVLLNLDLFSNHKYHIVNQRINDRDFTTRTQQLPYVFHDPLKLNNKVNPKSIKFGSKIEKGDTSKRPKYRIKKIINPTTYLLDSDLTVGLIGLKPKTENESESILYLEKHLLGKRVELKFDTEEVNNSEKLMVYMYLENRALVNSILLKKKLVEIDPGISHRMKKKFSLIASN